MTPSFGLSPMTFCAVGLVCYSVTTCLCCLPTVVLCFSRVPILLIHFSYLTSPTVPFRHGGAAGCTSRLHSDLQRLSIIFFLFSC